MCFENAKALVRLAKVIVTCRLQQFSRNIEMIGKAEACRKNCKIAGVGCGLGIPRAFYGVCKVSLKFSNVPGKMCSLGMAMY